MAAPMKSVCAAFRSGFCCGERAFLIKSLQKPNQNLIHKGRQLSHRAFSPGVAKWRRITKVTVEVGAGMYLGSLAWRLHGSANTVLADSPREKPKHKPVRSIVSNTDQSGLKLTLYQYQTCPFCCKVRAYLDFMGFSYDVVEVNSVRRSEIKWSDYKKVPILMVDGQGSEGFLQLNDSCVIISLLQSYLLDQTQSIEQLLAYYPGIEAGKKRGRTVYEFPNKYFIMHGEDKLTKEMENLDKEERKWRSWTDDVLVHVLSPNVYRSPGEAVDAFKWFSQAGDWERVFSTPERFVVIYVGAATMYGIGRMLKKKYKLKDDVRESLYDCCTEWTKNLGDRPFLGGQKPCLADLSVYGVLNAIEGCAAFQDALHKTTIGPWFRRMQNAVLHNRGVMHRDCELEQPTQGVIHQHL